MQRKVETCEIVVTAAAEPLVHDIGGEKRSFDEDLEFDHSGGFGSKLSRLSTAIRRSLRLGPKRTTTALRRKVENGGRAASFEMVCSL